MSREAHVRFCEGVGVKFPRATHLVVLCHSEAEARAALERIQRFTEANCLRLHPEKTRIVDARARGGFEFLGYHFERGMKWPRKKSVARLKASIRNKTKRTAGGSLQALSREINSTLRRWFEYFKHGKANDFELCLSSSAKCGH